MTEKKIIWVASYICQIEAEVGLPVRDAEPAHRALEKRQIRLITEELAQEMNARLSAESEGTKKYVDQLLDERRAFLRAAGYLP
jgi:hypothetical protein